jgi:SAM-dependent methyltransferase
VVGIARWQQAQQYERRYWEMLAARITEGSVSQLDWYRWRADKLALRFSALGLQHLCRGDARVVEVGCGPIGLIGFFPAAERVAVDPLEEFYARNSTLTELRDSSVQYRGGVGERLPCESARYDLAIIENCIDHVQDAHTVKQELGRVLKPHGVLYLTVNCRTPWGFVVHRVLSMLRIDAGHPYTFTPPRLKVFLEDGTFRILSLEGGSPIEALRADLRSRHAKARLKALLGISEFLVTVVAERLAAC